VKKVDGTVLPSLKKRNLKPFYVNLMKPEAIANIRAALLELFELPPEATDEQLEQAFDAYIESIEADTQAIAATARAEGEAAGAEAGQAEATAAKQEMQAQVKKFTAEITELKKQIDAFKGKAVDAEKVKFSAEVDVILADLVKGGKMQPAEVEAQKAILVSADRANKLKFSDNAEKTQFDALVSALQARPVAVALGEVTKSVESTAATQAAPADVSKQIVAKFSASAMDVDPKSLALDIRAREIASEKKIGFGAAMILAAKELSK